MTTDRLDKATMIANQKRKKVEYSEKSNIISFSSGKISLDTNVVIFSSTSKESSCENSDYNALDFSSK